MGRLTTSTILRIDRMQLSCRIRKISNDVISRVFSMILFVCNLPAVHSSYRELKEFQSVLRMQGVLFTD
jgi:hypothetical protein